MATRKNRRQYWARTLIVTSVSGKQINIKLTTRELGELKGVFGLELARKTEEHFLNIARNSMGEEVDHTQIDHRFPA